MKKGIVANVIKAKKTAIDPIGALSAECNSCAVRFSVPLSATFAESESVYHVDGSHSTDVKALESYVCTMVAACSVVQTISVLQVSGRRPLQHSQHFRCRRMVSKHQVDLRA
jgi:hypothetical protein